MTLIELVLIWAMGHTTGIATMLLCVWIGEKTGNKNEWYINREEDEEDEIN